LVPLDAFGRPVILSEDCSNEGGDCVIAAAILDRLLHDAVTMNIRGSSCRLKDKLKAGLVGSRDDNSSPPGGEI
jgi:hypothetical protein